MVTFQSLNLSVVLVFQLGYLHVLDVLKVSYLLFQLLDLIEKAAVL